MRTSLNKIKAIDDYLSEQMAAGDSLLFEANILLNNDLLNNVQHQRNTYALITQYSRKKIKDEIGNVQKIFATAPQNRAIMQRIADLFRKY